METINDIINPPFSRRSEMVIPLDQEQIDRIKKYRDNLNIEMVQKILDHGDNYAAGLVNQDKLFAEERRTRKWLEPRVKKYEL